MDDDPRQYLQGIDLARLPAHAGPVLVALGQFHAGHAVTARCPNCGHVIAVEPQGDPPSAWVQTCPCGTCNGSFRGL